MLKISMLLALTIAAAGCAPFATYPPVETTSALTSGEMEPFPTLMAEALWHVQQEYAGGGEQFLYSLPAESTINIYRKVDRRLGVGEPATEQNVPALHVRQVRARGAGAEVDVVYPRADGLYELVTVKLENILFKGWRVTDARRWRIEQEAPAVSWPPADAVPDAVAAGAVER